MKKISLIFKIIFFFFFSSFCQQTDGEKIKSIAFEKFDANKQSNFYVGELFQSFSISFDLKRFFLFFLILISDLTRSSVFLTDKPRLIIVL